MVEKSYNRNYLSIYFWKILRIISGILSMSIVIPLLSSSVQIYGIYALCISITAFLQYSDFGFLSAGQKYASEYFALGDRENEIKMLSFVHFIMLVFIIGCSLVIQYFAFNPKVIIPDLEAGVKNVASGLLTILAVTSPFIVLQRYAQSIFTIRIEDHKFQKIDLAGNVLKVLGIYFFYSNKTVDIVNYFVFIQIINLLTVVVSFLYVKFLYNYDFSLVFKSFKFDREVYRKTKNLAVSSIISTVSWIVFFQIDSLIISKFFGIRAVATYAIPYVLLTFINNLYNTIYYPFLFRFNQFTISANNERLYAFLNKIFEITLPLFIFPISILLLLLNPLITSWVGPEYINSVLIGQILLTSLFWLFFTMPFSYLLLSREKIRVLNINSFLLPCIFILFIFFFKGQISILSLAVGKSFALFFSSVYLYQNCETGGFKFTKFVGQRALSIISSLTVMLISYSILKHFVTALPPKSLVSMVKVIGVGLILGGLSFSVYIFMNKRLYNIILDLYKSLFSKHSIT